MKLPRWLPYAGIVAFYITLAVLLRLWLAPLNLNQRQPERAQVLHQWSVLSERVAVENERLRELVLRDSLERALPPAPGLYINFPSDTVAFITPDGPASPMAIRPLAEKEVGRDPKVITILMPLPKFGGHPGVREGVWRSLRISGEVNGQPYCASAIALMSRNRDRHPSLFARSGMFGECAFWSRYGPPGRDIQRWLDQGGSHFAVSDPAHGVWDYTARISSLPGPGELRFRLPLAGQACLAGRQDVCGAAVLNPQRILGWPDSMAGLNDWVVRIAPAERALLSRLERDFGPDRFARFWTSTEPIEVSFHSAFGVRIGAWVYSVLKPAEGFQHGARIGGTSILLSLLFLGICFGAALATAQRRRV
jgi:hypothetical protein